MRMISFCGLFGNSFTKLINKIFNTLIIYHRSYCRREGRCVECGRYICGGCNSIKNGIYGYCSACADGKENYIILPIKPLTKPKNIKQYYETCNKYCN